MLLFCERAGCFSLGFRAVDNMSWDDADFCTVSLDSAISRMG